MNNTYTETTSLNRFYGKVYGFFSMGLAISALAAYLSINMFREQVFSFLQNFPLGITGIWLVEFALVIVVSAKAQKNPSLTIAGFIVYALLNGFTLSVTLMLYSQASIALAFATATLTFVGMSLYGMFTKRDLSRVGQLAIGLLWGVIIATLLNFFLASSAVNYFLSYITVLIFIGLTAYDNQQIRKLYAASQGQDRTGLAAFMGLQLDLDFINLFLSLLRIFSRD